MDTLLPILAFHLPYNYPIQFKFSWQCKTGGSRIKKVCYLLIACYLSIANLNHDTHVLLVGNRLGQNLFLLRPFEISHTYCNPRRRLRITLIHDGTNSLQGVWISDSYQRWLELLYSRCIVTLVKRAVNITGNERCAG